MRLIDADKLNEELYEAVMQMQGYRAQGFEIARNIVSKQPTAYDVEKVVEQIKREQYDIPECSYERGFNAMARFAQKVVRKGGVE